MLTLLFNKFCYCELEVTEFNDMEHTNFVRAVRGFISRL